MGEHGSIPKRAAIARRVERAVLTTPVFDIHTHLYDPAFRELLLWGIDDLLVYHYLVAEVFRYLDEPFEQFHRLPKTAQAERIWETLFLKHSPVSEACRGVVTTLNRLGFDLKRRDLPALRRWFSKQNPEKHLTRCLELAGVEKVCMTNSPFDDVERAVWERRFGRDDRFVAGLRIDPLLLDWKATAPRLAGWGYQVESSLSASVVSEVRRFLMDWTRRIQPQYLMISLPPDFAYPSPGTVTRLLDKAVLPHCRESGLPLALMLGVKRAVNLELGLAGDGVGRSDLRALENLCAGHPGNRFLTTVLSRENQHELCVLARKFRNLHIFGCWWFTNVPQVVEEMTRMRLELVGLSVTPQHSDARVLEQLIYKWQHFRQCLAGILSEKYTDLAARGWEASAEEVQRDVTDLLGGAFRRFCAV